MNTTKQLYEAPTIRCNGDVVQHTRARLINGVEPDHTPLSAMGSVGFGV